jgi:hypothetical protein
MMDECLTHKQLCNCDKNHLMLAFKTGYKDRTIDDYHLLLIPRVKLKLSLIKNARYVVP